MPNSMGRLLKPLLIAAVLALACAPILAGPAIAIEEIKIAKSHPEESSQILVDWIHVKREVALKSLKIGKSSWSDNGRVSDAAVKLLGETAP